MKILLPAFLSASLFAFNIVPLNAQNYVPAQKVTANKKESSNYVLISPKPGFIDGAALSSFRLSFMNGDHWVRRLGVLQVGNTPKFQAEFSLADRNSDDGFYSDAAWYQSSSIKSTSYTALGAGDFEIDLDAELAKNYVPVIKGFMLQRRNLNDSQVRGIGIKINPKTNKARIFFLDDEGALERGWETAIGEKYALSDRPKGVLRETGINAFDAGIKMNQQEVYNGMRQFFVSLQVAWVPKEMVASYNSLSGTNDKILNGKMPLATNKSVISGFSFHFLDSQHHLMDIGIDPNFNGIFSFAFQDSDQVDPIHWSVDFVNIN